MITLPFVVLLQITGDMAPVAPGGLEGRPPAEETSALQARVDRAAPGDTVVVGPGTFAGDLVLDRPVHLVGQGRPRLVGSGKGSVVRVRADGVTLEGFDIDGVKGGDLGKDSSGVHIAASNVTVRDCRISDALFGVYLRQADGAHVEKCRIRGIHGRDPGEKGSGLHVWDTKGFTFEDNVIEDVRDGFYIQSSSGGTIVRNVARDLRYGLHYMFSDDNTFEENTFENGAAGTALMYSKRIVFRRNRFLRNRGFASVGLLFKACDDVLAEDNLIADNARGIFLEGSYRNAFRRNVVALSDAAIVLYDSCGQNRFEGNSFVGNLTPLALVGHRTDTVFDGNYWSDNDEPDLDGDGLCDRPFPLSSVFDHLRGNLTAADLFSRSLAARALGAAERGFPVLREVEVFDRSPLAHPPSLPRVPHQDRPVASEGAFALAMSGLSLIAGGGVLLFGTEALVIRFEAFSKSFGAQRAVSDLTLAIEPGEIVALLGPNGSGKTTSLKAAAGLIHPTSGGVTVGKARQPATEPAARRTLSFLPQKVTFPDSLTGREVLDFYRALRGVANHRVDEALRMASLNGASGRAVGTYSGGMTQRLGLAVAALPDSPVLLLDEPTAALDPDGLCAFYGLAVARRREGKTVLFTTHQLGDVERLADRVGVLVEGKLVALLTRGELDDWLLAHGFPLAQIATSPLETLYRELVGGPA